MKQYFAFVYMIDNVGFHFSGLHIYMTFVLNRLYKMMVTTQKKTSGGGFFYFLKMNPGKLKH